MKSEPKKGGGCTAGMKFFGAWKKTINTSSFGDGGIAFTFFFFSVQARITWPVGAIGNRLPHLRRALHPGDGDASSLRFTPGHSEPAAGPRFIPLDSKQSLKLEEIKC